MGSAVSSIFGSGAGAVEQPKLSPLPTSRESEAEGQSVRDSERRKLLARQNGVAGNLLGSSILGSLSAGGGNSGAGKSLGGQKGKGLLGSQII